MINSLPDTSYFLIPQPEAETTRLTMYRVTMASLLGVVAVLALGLAAVRSASVFALSLSVTVTQIVLLFSVLGAAVRPAPAAAWRGFAIFGCGYFSFAFVTINTEWPTEQIAMAIGRRFHPAPNSPQRPSLSREGDPIHNDKNELVWIVQKTQSNPDGTLPLSIEDATAWQSYLIKLHNAVFGMDLDDNGRRAKLISNACLSLLFGLLGAIVGPIMARKRNRLGRSRPNADLQTETNLEPTGTHGR